MEEDIRWIQRLFNLKKAFNHLDSAIQKEKLNMLEQMGLIQCFEFTYELAWLTLKDYLTEIGIEEIRGSKDTFRHAFSEGLIDEGHKWQQMVTSRSLTSHTYNEKTANAVEKDIRSDYHRLLKKLIERMQKISEKE